MQKIQINTESLNGCKEHSTIFKVTPDLKFNQNSV